MIKKSKNSKKLSGILFLLVGVGLFLFGYYLGLPKSTIDNKEIATYEYPLKQVQEPKSKKNIESIKSSDRHRDILLNDWDEDENAKPLVSQKSLEEMLVSAQSETNPIKRSAAFARALET